MNDKLKNFFDEYSSNCRSDRYSKEEITQLLSICNLKPNEKVLDLGCGTGIIDGYLLDCKVDFVGLDLSPKMIEIAKEKYPNSTFIVKDFYDFNANKFDKIIVFDAYPHFVDKTRFVRKCYDLLNKDGHLYIIHGASKEVINNCHNNLDSDMSTNLLSPIEEYLDFASLFIIEKYLDSNFYYIILRRK